MHQSVDSARPLPLAVQTVSPLSCRERARCLHRKRQGAPVVPVGSEAIGEVATQLFFCVRSCREQRKTSDCFVSKNGSVYSPCNLTPLPLELCRKWYIRGSSGRSG